MPEPGDLERILGALQRSGARYLVVGGVAVVLHGHPRFTADLDLVTALETEELRRALSSFRELGFRPRAPVALEDMLDPETRRSWVAEKNLLVLSLWSAAFPLTEIDLFVEPPFAFEPAYRRALHADLGNLGVTVAGLPDLIEMKRRAGRPRDLEDVRALEEIARESGNG